MATKQNQPATQSLRGRMLIAAPLADNSPYRRSAVLLLEHNAEGASGVILDDSFAASLRQLRQQLPRITGTQQLPIAGLAAVPVKVAMWQPGQLDHELQSGVWFNAPANPQRLLSEGVPPWHVLVREVGRSVYREALGIKGFPHSPWLN
ncbi:MAG TPA: YqgE/AlgH family protein [Pirellulaceae bacterium]|nr:YqgE/AlgH family protein [Planctomycetales bacterium]MCB9939109.1 YqgE/AlgH family protein [Planctomycetaceae bacterium]HRX78545.1 YqgE/AlgH family protein [Pirellulaceae bacterium]